MRLQAYNDNGTMKFRQVSGSQALDSLPVGTSTSYSGSVAPNGYLFCDGSTFDAAKYPELFSKLGTNVLPVWSDPSQPTAKLPINGTGSIPFNLTTTNTAAPYDGIINFGFSVAHVRTIYINDIPRAISGNPDSGNTTQVQVNKGDLVRVQLSLDTATSYNWAIWYTKPMLIKVKTIGIADIDINTIKNSLSYSTDEILTGGTWIDGKPIYRRVLVVQTAFSLGTSWVDIVPYCGNPTLNMSTLTYQMNTVEVGAYMKMAGPNSIIWERQGSYISIPVGAAFIIEYTKTTE